MGTGLVAFFYEKKPLTPSPWLPLLAPLKKHKNLLDK